MLSAAFRDDSLYLTTQGGLAFPGTFSPTTPVLVVFLLYTNSTRHY